jgi:hypothetical protein
MQLNEFRKFLGLKPFAKFEDWNPDPTIWKPAESLYHHVDVRGPDRDVNPRLTPSARTWSCTPGCKQRRPSPPCLVSTALNSGFVLHDR